MVVRRAVAAACLLLVVGCAKKEVTRVPGGDTSRGKAAIVKYGCGSCHTIPGVRGADGLVGPPLDTIGSRVYLAGKLANTPKNMVYWICYPQAVVPGNAMPDMNVNDQDARDIAATLYTRTVARIHLPAAFNCFRCTFAHRYLVTTRMVTGHIWKVTMGTAQFHLLGPFLVHAKKDSLRGGFGHPFGSLRWSSNPSSRYGRWSHRQ